MLIDQKNTIIGTFISRNIIKVFKPSGRIDSESCYKLRCQMMEIVQTNPDILILNMENISFVDSYGLGLLVAILRIMDSYGGKLELAKINPEIAMLLEITKTDILFEIHDRIQIEGV